MATEEVLKSFNAVAGADLSTHQYKFVKLNGNRQVILCAAATDIPIGVLQNNPVNGGAATVGYHGITKVKASAALVAGAQVATDAAGLALTAVGGTDTTKTIVGSVLTGVANANELAEIGISTFGAGRGA